MAPKCISIYEGLDPHDVLVHYTQAKIRADKWAHCCTWAVKAYLKVTATDSALMQKALNRTALPP